MKGKAKVYYNYYFILIMDVAEPYIGVTGLTSLEEVFNVTNLFEK